MRYFPLILLLLLPSLALAQAKLRNSVYGELGGLAGHYSVNYDRELPLGERLSIHVGVGFSPSLFRRETGFTPRIPAHANLAYRLGRHTLDLGLGITPYFYNYKATERDTPFKEQSVCGFAELGYLYNFPGSAWFAGAAFTPSVFDSGEAEFFPWGAIRIGRRF